MNALIRRLLGLPLPRHQPTPPPPPIRGEDDPLTRSRRTETNMQAVQQKIQRSLDRGAFDDIVLPNPPRRQKGSLR